MMDKHALPFMRRATVLLTASLFLFTALAGCLETLSSDSPPTVTMNVSPSGTVKVGDTVQFSATGSSDPDGDPLSFNWKFGDGDVGTGQTASHVYNSQGTFTAELCVSSTDFEICEEREIIVAAADAAEPTASIVTYKDSSCQGDDPPSGTFILAWICEEEMDTSDESIDATTTIQLDGSDSSAGDASTYITDYSWDLDTYIDSDGDGFIDQQDNCPRAINRDQVDSDADGIGNVCEDAAEFWTETGTELLGVGNPAFGVPGQSYYEQVRGR